MVSLWTFLANQPATPVALPAPPVRALLDAVDLPLPPAGLPPANGALNTSVSFLAAAAQAIPLLGRGLELPAAPLATVPSELRLSADSNTLGIAIGPVPLELPLPGLRRGVIATTPAGEPTVSVDSVGGEARLTARFMIRITLAKGARAALELHPDPAGDNAQIAPPTVVVGSTGFALNVAKVRLLSASPVSGFAIEKATFYLSPWVPFVGAGRAEITNLFVEESGIRGPATGELQTRNGPSTIRLLVRWDRPGQTSFANAPPTLVELSGNWDVGGLTLPGQHGGSVTGAALGGTNGFRFVARWSADPAGPGMTFAAAIEGPGGPEGLFAVEGAGLPTKTLAAALGLGPGVLGLASPRTGDPKTTTLAELLTRAAPIAAAAVTRGRVTVYGLGVEEYVNDGLTPPKITADYTAEIGFDLDGGPLGRVRTSANDPMRVRCRGVRVALGPNGGPADLALGYDGAQVEVESPGSWQVVGPAAKLLRVSRTRSGGGSVWFEVDLAVAADLGVVRVDEATLRVTFQNGSFTPEVRGLGVSVHVPGLIDGKGYARIGTGGLDAGLNAKLLPINLGVATRLQLRNKMIGLEMGVDFPGAIPFANSGLGLYGVSGQFALRAERDLGNHTDPVTRELLWSNTRDFDEGTNTVLGLAAVVGTVPDLGYSLSTRGALVVTFPDPAVILTVNGRFLSERQPVLDGYVPGGTGFKFIGLVAVDSSGVTFALRGEYNLSPLLVATVPLGAYFPSSSSNQPAYVRLGTDGYPGKPGAPPRPPGPVSIVVSPTFHRSTSAVGRS
jgi:hypothetical protein